jgi:hypothetical protein
MNGADIGAEEARRSDQLVWRDAAETMAAFWTRGRADQALFDASVGMLVQRMASKGRPLRIYGEMVDLLAVDGDLWGASALEGLWNELGQRVRFTLLCGYSAAAFGDPRSAAALRAICVSHSQVLSDPRDQLGSFLVDAYGAHARTDGRPS